MNRDEILAMKPGRELDALVNELVLGQCLHQWVKSGPNVWNYNCEKCHATGGNFANHKLVICGDGQKRPSTDISAAWEVVEKLQEHHLYVDIRTCADFYEVWITRWETGEVTSTVAYPKLPEAICKAALLAVLEEPNEQ